MLFRSARLALLVLLLLPAQSADAQSLVYLLDEGVALSCSVQRCYGPTLHLINAPTGRELATIEATPRGQKGTSVRASSDGRHLFVTSVPFLSPTQPGLLLVVDAFSKTTIATIPVGAGPTDVAILPDNSRAYVVNGSADTVSVVDLTTFAVTATIAVQSAPARIVAAVNGSAVYVTNSGSGTVSKISTLNDTVALSIAVGSGPSGIDISADGSRLFVANTASQTVSVIDANLDSLLRNLPAGTGPLQPRDVAARSATRVFVGLRSQGGVVTAATTPGIVHLLDAVTGAVLGSSLVDATRLGRDSSGSPSYVIDGALLRSLAADGASAAIVSSSFTNLTGVAVITDPCAFEAAATATVFGAGGGAGTLTIPAPAGCRWTITTNRVTGLSVTTPLTGIGPATRTFAVAGSTVPRIGALDIGRQEIEFEQTIPRMNVEFASGSTVSEPFAIGGWAIDENAFSDGTALGHTGIDAIHVWAYPAAGVPVFVGVAGLGIARPDIAALFTLKYQQSGFSITIGSLPSGAYTLVFYAHSSRSGTFSNTQAVSVVVQQAPRRIVIDAPAVGAVTLTPFRVAGWAVDPNAASGAGVDAVHIYAYPDSGGAPSFLGAAQTAINRPDVAAAFGAASAQSGFDLPLASLTPGGYTLVVYARSTVTRAFFAQSQRLTIQASAARMTVDVPATSRPIPLPLGAPTQPGTRITSPFTIAGWALDFSAGAGSGVDAVQAWAYPASGAAPLFVGTGAVTTRADVAAAFGAAFLGSGFQINGATLPAGTYDLIVHARSTITGTFNNSQVVRITVQ